MQKIVFKFSAFLNKTSILLPSNSISKYASCFIQNGISHKLYLLTSSIEDFSMNSIHDGKIPLKKIWDTTLQADSIFENGTNIKIFFFGRDNNFKTAFVTIPKVPSLPTINWVILYPVEFFNVLAPVQIICPSGSTTSKFKTKFDVTPYFTALGPPAFSEILPPKVQLPLLAGSGG